MRVDKYLITTISSLIFAASALFYNYSGEKNPSQFLEDCFYVQDKFGCAESVTTFKNKSARTINPDFYDDRYAFWILDTIHSYDCSRIESAMEKVVEDKPLYDYFDVNLDICIHEVENDKREKDIYINTDIYKYEEPNLDIYPEDTIFVAPSEYA